MKKEKDLWVVKGAAKAPIGVLFYFDYIYKYDDIQKDPIGQIFNDIDSYGEEIWE